MSSRLAPRLVYLPITLLMASAVSLAAAGMRAPGDVESGRTMGDRRGSSVGEPSAGSRLSPTEVPQATIEMTRWDTLMSARKNLGALREPVDSRTGRSIATGRILIKLREDWSPRAPLAGSARVESSNDEGLQAFNNIVGALGLRVRPALDQSPDLISAVTARIAARSGKTYPDFNTYFYVEGAGAQLVSAARLLGSLPEVTSIEIEERTVQSQVDCAACGDPACGFQPWEWVQCDVLTQTGCDFGIPAKVYDPESCTEYMWAPGAAWAGCCATVGAILPTCADTVDEGGAWDASCVGIAELLCTPSYFPNGDATAQLDTCLGTTFAGNVTPIHPNVWAFFASVPPDPNTGPCDLGTGVGSPGGMVYLGYSSTSYWADSVQVLASSFVPHPLPGTNLSDCCAAVCAQDFLCCTITWDENCAALAMAVSQPIGGVPGALPFSPCLETFARTQWPLADNPSPVTPGGNPQLPDGSGDDGPPAEFPVQTAPVAPGSLPGVAANFPAGGNISLGDKFDPSADLSPFYGWELLNLEDGGAPVPVTDFPLAAATTVEIVNNNNDLVDVEAQAGSLPLALWGTETHAAYGADPFPPANNSLFEVFQAVTSFKGGGLEMEALNAFIKDSTATGAVPKYFARGVKVAVVDKGAYVNHEEFLDDDGKSVIRVEAGIPMFLTIDRSDYPNWPNGLPAGCDPAELVSVVGGSPSVIWPHHGTAVLGVLFAERDGKGVSGLCTNASQKWFFPSVTAGDPDSGLPSGDRLNGALMGAVAELTEPEVGSDPSNVCIVPINKGGADRQPLNTGLNGELDLTATLLSLGADGGITWVLSAGNGASAVAAAIVDPDVDIDASRCVITGACWPGQRSDFGLLGGVQVGLIYGRIGESNYDASDEPTNNMTTSGWGRGVTTCGYGDLFLGDNSAITAESGYVPDCYETNKLRTYTTTFTGTSAAAAQIGGLIACIQAHAKVVFGGVGIPASAWLELFQTPINKFPQAGLVAPPFISPNPNLGDNDDPDGDVRALIGGFPRAKTCAENVSTGDWLDLSNDSTSTVLVGTTLSGNTYSLKQVDGNYLTIKSTGVSGGSASAGYGGAAVFYPSTSRAMDLQVLRALNIAKPSDLYFLRTRLYARVSGGFVYAFTFTFNPRVRRYDFWGFAQLNQNFPEDPLNFCMPAYRVPADYVRMNDPNYPGGVIAARFISGGYGMFGQFQQVTDMAVIEVNNPQAPIDPCVGQ
ncbi:MAG: hypothetical protein O2819_01440 [Planctomycetota bacterium]|nr:hypothetical protein [Planctomycetota bacterium]